MSTLTEKLPVSKDPEASKKIVEVVSHLRPERYPHIVKQLKRIAARPTVEMVEVLDDVLLDRQGVAGGFSVPINVYVRLAYGKGKKKGSVGGGFPGLVVGSYDNGKVTIDNIRLETEKFLD